MKCAIITTYPPRECGIATFTEDLFNNMLPNEENFIVALDDPGEEYDYPEYVKYTIRQEHYNDYIQAASFINEHADICMLQHEFNIFGGNAGIYILSLINSLKIPLVSTLHTVLDEPNDLQKQIIKEISHISRKNILLSQSAADILQSTYEVENEKISMIRHAVPDIRLDPDETKRKLGLEGQTVILTFGLINRNKGMETVLKALPEVVKKHPSIKYIMLGKTHPAIKRMFGEEYREYLEKLTVDLDLEEYVRFENRFVDTEELNEYLAATDILITPYLNKAQVSSGPLSFAMGVGAVLMSTPYWHARELLADGRGKLFDFRDYEKLSEDLIFLLDEPDEMNSIRNKVRVFGKKITWPIIGEDFHSLMHAELESSKKDSKKNYHKCIDYPEISFHHLYKLTDDTGMLSDAVYGFPRLGHGYHLHHNARALLAACKGYRLNKNKELIPLITTYLSFLQFMQNDDGTFKRHLSYNRTVSRENSGDDDTGLVLWSLGYLIHHPPENVFQELSKEIFLKTTPLIHDMKDHRGIAYAIMGLFEFMQKFRDDQVIMEHLYHLTDELTNRYRENSCSSWKWFGDTVDYDHPVLPLAMFAAGEFKQDKELQSIAIEATDFLTGIMHNDGHFSLIGNKNWYHKDGAKSLFDQLPVNAMGMILLYSKAFERTKDKKYFRLMRSCYRWFFGVNDLYINLYDPSTRGCFDGLQADGVNRNHGAESTLALIISGLEIEFAKKHIKKLKDQKK